MFGLSLAELIVVAIVALLFIKPQDLPEIAHFVGRIFYRGKKLFEDGKKYLKNAGDDLGIDELRHELNRGIAEEKSKLEDDVTVIVDIYGNEHRVANIENLRSDLSKDEIESEIEKSNQENRQTNSNQTPSQS